MASTLVISGKVLGKTQPVFTDWELELADDRPTMTLRSLLSEIVRAEVAAFQARQSQRRLIQILSPAQIRLGLKQGKIESGGSELNQDVNVETAVETALQAFEDGLYFVFLDDQQQENLDDAISLQPNSQLLFLRLVALVGG